MKNLVIYISLFLFASLFGVRISAQTTDSLKTVEIIEKKTNNTEISHAGNFKFQIDSQYRQAYNLHTLDKLLQEQSHLFVRSYGINNSATFSIRGTSAAQNMVLWEGIPINSPTMGAADISILNNTLFSKIAIELGSNSLEYGSGNIGGNIQLNNYSPNFQKQLKNNLHLGLGSFSNNKIGNQFVWSSNNIQVQINGFYNSAKNDFNYLKNGNYLELENATATAYGGIGSIFIKLPTNERFFKHVLNFQYWIQEYQRAIPPALFENNSTKFQKDFSQKSQLKWQLSARNLDWAIQAAYIKDQLIYNDTNIHLYNQYAPITYFTQAQVKYLIPTSSKLGIHKLSVITPIHFNSIAIQQTGKVEHQNRQAIALLYFWRSNNNKIGIQSGLRKEWASNLANIPIVPSLSGNIHLFGTEKAFQLQLVSSIQRAYRLPSLHELYFFPGGNENLLPEQGWNYQFGLDASIKTKVTTQKITATIYKRNIKDWIYWMGGAIWTPHNIAAVTSKGLDMQYAFEYNIHNNWQAKTQISYAYAIATTSNSYIPNDKSIGKQIPYVPRNLINNNVTLTYKHTSINFNQGYTGYRFTTTDESNYLNPYYLANLHINHTFSINKIALIAGLVVNNIFNKDYTVVANRPMPGRNYLLTLQFSFSDSKN